MFYFIPGKLIAKPEEDKFCHGIWNTLTWSPGNPFAGGVCVITVVLVGVGALLVGSTHHSTKPFIFVE